MNDNFIFKNLEKKVFNKSNTRFPPEPNGCLHIGHIKAILINYALAIQFNKNFFLRFDDTNPEDEKKEFIKLIKNDIFWLNIFPKYINFTSNYFYYFFKKAIFLIKNNKAFVDQLSYEQFLCLKGNFKCFGIDSKYRVRSIKENIFLFKRMKNGFFRKNNICLRAKISMKSKNLLLRDPVLFRIKYINHYRLKNTWCIFPTYDFSHCLSDYIENVNLSICTMEFIENKHLYDWILKNIYKNFKNCQIEFAKLKIKNFNLSKKSINSLIKIKNYKGWDNYNLFTILGLRNRGISSLFLKFFCNQIGLTRKNSLINISYFENLLNKFLIKNSLKLMIIFFPVILIIINLKKTEFIYYLQQINNFNFYSTLILTKKIYLDYFEIYNLLKKKKYIIKLRYCYIIFIYKIILNLKNEILQIFSILINKNFIKNINVINWISDKNFFVNVLFINNFSTLYDKNLYIDEYYKKGIVDFNLFYLNQGQNIFFEKVGFFKIKSCNLNYELQSIYLY